jgi:hypothetical protein
LAIGVRSKNKNNDRTPESSKESSNRNNKLSDSEDLDKNENRKPVAYAGPEQIVYEGSKITLEGSCNLDSEKHPNRDISYAWELDANHTNTSTHAELDNPNIKNPSFYAPYVEFDSNKGQSNNPYTTLTFKLVVTDKNTELSSDPSRVTIIVKMIQRALVL